MRTRRVFSFSFSGRFQFKWDIQELKVQNPGVTLDGRLTCGVCLVVWNRVAANVLLVAACEWQGFSARMSHSSPRGCPGWGELTHDSCGLTSSVVTSPRCLKYICGCLCRERRFAPSHRPKPKPPNSKNEGQVLTLYTGFWGIDSRT